jgi:hypothetical protein
VRPTIKTSEDSGERQLYRPLKWPVYDCEIVTREPDGGIGVVFRYRNRERPRGERWPAEGVILAKGYRPETVEASKPARTYRPLPVAGEILAEISRLEGKAPETLLCFVKQWGFFGHGEYYSAVDDVRRQLAWLKNCLSSLYKIQRHGSRTAWENLAWDLNSVGAGLRWQWVAGESSNTLRRACNLTSLWDALILQLGMWAEHTDVAIRECAYSRCRAFFMPDRRDQIYCKTQGEQICARRASLEALRARRRLPQGRRNQR